MNYEERALAIAKHIRDLKTHVLLIAHPGSITTMAAHRVACPHGDHITNDGPHLRNFRAPHHTCSDVALRGVLPKHDGHIMFTPGRPGEIALAHGGVLLLDQLNEFSMQCLETIERAIDHFNEQEASKRTIVIGTMYPCPCGYLGRSDVKCKCSDAAIDRWRSRIKPSLRNKLHSFDVTSWQ